MAIKGYDAGRGTASGLTMRCFFFDGITDAFERANALCKGIYERAGVQLDETQHQPSILRRLIAQQPASDYLALYYQMPVEAALIYLSMQNLNAILKEIAETTKALSSEV